MVTPNFQLNPMYFIIPLIVGFILDSILGDPLWLPHPIRLFGKMISLSDKKFNSGNHKKLKGVFIVLFLIGSIFICLLLIQKFIIQYQYFYYCFACILVFYGLANRSLITEVLKVERVLSKKGIEAGRKQLSHIVGRDTSKLSENEIRIAILETLSENLSDGVIAPLFYYFIGGVPLMFTYKMINTLDSMIAYKSVKYKDFGWFAAKLDDIANFIPARITAFLMVCLTLSKKGFLYIFVYGGKHTSPNAGYPEAALAGILDGRFGGSGIYHGKLIRKPYIGVNEKEISRRDIIKACCINYFSSLLFLVIICLSYFLIIRNY